jgi:hypothetical protein
MVAAARFVTFTDVDRDAARAGQASVVVRHDAVLTDGRRLTIFDGRGWSWSVRRGEGDAVNDPWTWTSTKDIEDTARVVVGPDEPLDGRSQHDMEVDHRAHIARLARVRPDHTAGRPQQTPK